MRISILILGIVPLITESAFTYYKKNQENDDKKCHAEDTVITDDTTSNEAKCLGLCSLNSACRSIFVNTDLNICYGCSRMYDDPTELPSSSGTKHLWKPSKYMDPCTGDTECVHGVNQGCNNNTCTCKPGYPFDEASTRCVTSCQVYGSSFQVYAFKKLDVTSDETMSLQFLPDACKTYCASQSWCLGFDHSAVTMKCYFKSVTAVTYPSDLKFDLIFFHYSRNCQ